MRYVAVIFLLFVALTASAQQPSAARADLERRRQAIIESIKESQQQLEETKANKNATLAELRALQSKLDGRMRLIGNINQEISAISGDIQSSSKEVSNLQQNLAVLKLRYAQSVRYAYKNRSSKSMLAFLFSAADYNDAVRRMKFLKRYRDYRKQQAEEIRMTQDRIENKITVLNTQKNQQSILLSAEEQQRQVLQKETAETNNVVKQLKGREKELLADIEKNRKAAEKVKKAVNALIAREIEEQRRKAMEEARRKAAEEARREQEEARRLAAQRAAANNGGMSVATGSGNRSVNPPPYNPSGNANTNAGNSRSSSTGASSSVPTASTVVPRSSAHTATPRELSMTPESIALSNSFAANRGRLPWPVDRGTVTSPFGPHKHPVANVIITNNGIDIQTSTNATARAVFDGTVSSVFDIPGSGKNVLIVHGDYFTVYANLASVSVSKGQKVTTRQAIGTVDNNEEGLPTINFQIWKSKNNVNPALWLAPMH